MADESEFECESECMTTEQALAELKRLFPASLYRSVITIDTDDSVEIDVFTREGLSVWHSSPVANLDKCVVDAQQQAEQAKQLSDV